MTQNFQEMNCYSYVFFDPESSIKKMTNAQLKKAKVEFSKLIQKRKDVLTLSYGTLGLKNGTRFMLFMRAASPEIIQNFVRDLLHTSLGLHLKINYTLLGMTRPSQYSPKSHSGDSKNATSQTSKASVKENPKGSEFDTPHKYLVVYPFTKTIEWYLLPFEERRNMMKSHVEVGRKYSSGISQLLLYSFGIDDHEFIVSYQMNTLEDFQALVMELRSTEARRYTLNDTPIFTCISMPISEALEMI